MGVHCDASRRKYVVRWHADHAAAPVAAHLARTGDVIHAYETRPGTRWRFVYRQSDGKSSSRRGFTSRSAARCGAPTSLGVDRARRLPTFASVPLARIDEDLGRTWFAGLAAQVDAREISAKTINTQGFVVTSLGRRQPLR